MTVTFYLASHLDTNSYPSLNILNSLLYLLNLAGHSNYFDKHQTETVLQFAPQLWFEATVNENSVTRVDWMGGGRFMDHFVL